MRCSTSVQLLVALGANNRQALDRIRLDQFVALKLPHHLRVLLPRLLGPLVNDKLGLALQFDNRRHLAPINRRLVERCVRGEPGGPGLERCARLEAPALPLATDGEGGVGGGQGLAHHDVDIQRGKIVLVVVRDVALVLAGERVGGGGCVAFSSAAGHGGDRKMRENKKLQVGEMRLIQGRETCLNYIVPQEVLFRNRGSSEDTRVFQVNKKGTWKKINTILKRICC